MRYLADTHLLVWAALDRQRISKRAQHALVHPDAEVFVSHTSLWELAIKHSTGKLQLPSAVDAFFTHTAAHLQAQKLPIREQHMVEVQHLPWHHRDPFDRLLIAQARTENLVILSADERFSDYPVAHLW